MPRRTRRSSQCALAAAALVTACVAVSGHAHAPFIEIPINEARLQAHELELPPVELATIALSTKSHKPQPIEPSCSDCFLVIGVKVSSLHGADERRTIRETWAQPATLRELNTRVVFLGCQPDLSALTPDQAVSAIAALDQEKKQYRDLLTHELEHCHDSYYQLVEKTTAFLHWAV